MEGTLRCHPNTTLRFCVSFLPLFLLLTISNPHTPTLDHTTARIVAGVTPKRCLLAPNMAWFVELWNPCLLLWKKILNSFVKPIFIIFLVHLYLFTNQLPTEALSQPSLQPPHQAKTQRESNQYNTNQQIQDQLSTGRITSIIPNTDTISPAPTHNKH